MQQIDHFNLSAPDDKSYVGHVHISQVLKKHGAIIRIFSLQEYFCCFTYRVSTSISNDQDYALTHCYQLLVLSQ